MTQRCRLTATPAFIKYRRVAMGTPTQAAAAAAAARRQTLSAVNFTCRASVTHRIVARLSR